MKRIISTIVLLTITLTTIAHAATPLGDKIMTRWGRNVTAENAWREYPRPQLKRDKWVNLNGLWEYAITKKDDVEPQDYQGDILVPYCVESTLSGVGRRVTPEEKLWYKLDFEISPDWKKQNTILHFGAVDWHSEVWVNGSKVGENRGGSNAFSFDITKYLNKKGKQSLVVSVVDPTSDGYQARGKQHLNPSGIWYTPVTGIWQTVWMESVASARIDRLIPKSDIYTKEVVLATQFKGVRGNETVSVNVYDNDKVVASYEGSVDDVIKIHVPNGELWSPATPKLYYFDMTLSRGGRVMDSVKSYFAFRKVSHKKDAFGRSRMALNDKITFQYGTLDQGWWPDGLLTPPSAEAMRWDMEILQKMGFNTIRKHIKIEPALYYYYADSLGMMLWQDMPSGFSTKEKASYVQPTDQKDWDCSPENAKQWESELKTMIDDLSFFPSITTWVIFNEGWGQYNTAEVVNWAIDYDKSRLINGVSGWTDRKVGQMYDLHNYPATAMEPMGTIQDRIQVLGEFGGLGLAVENHLWNPSMHNWGYKNFASATVLLNDYTKLIYDLEPLIKMGLSGAIYTQTSDVEGEINGLLTYDREVVKFPTEIMHIIHSRLYTAQPMMERALITDSRIEQNNKMIAVNKRLTDKPEYISTKMPFKSDQPIIISSRSEFNIDKLPTALSLQVELKGGFKVWINGHLVMDNKGVIITRHYNNFSLSNYIQYLKPGKNVLEIENQTNNAGTVFDYCLYAM